MSTANSMQTARAALQRWFGYDDFRPGQRDVVASVLDNHDTLGVLPTGGGKSLCYQVPALVRPGLTLVISPLISLMKDQVDRLAGCGVPAAFINSTLSTNELSRRLWLAIGGELKLLYVAPERFEGTDLVASLGRCTVSLLAVDEAHCISEWGHDFRPSFRRIAEVAGRIGRPQLVALTATATPSVRADVVRQLAMRHARVIVSGFDRPNLHYSVRECRTAGDKQRALVETLRRSGRPAVVYASTRSAVQRTATLLTRAGVRAVAYHAGLDDDHRREVQEEFMGGACDVIVATNAFGMGIDKSDVRVVVHQAMPGTLEAYYQEAGRAGRDGAPARCVLLHSYRDRFTHEWFIRGMFPDRRLVERVYDTIRAAAHMMTTARHGSTRQASREQALAPRDVESAMRLLERERIVSLSMPGRLVELRLLATPERIRRELGDADHAFELGVLRAIWRGRGRRLNERLTIDLDHLPPGLSGRFGRVALESLRDRQFVYVGEANRGPRFAQPSAPLDSFAIDWHTMSRRRGAELARLDMMQQYAYTKNCRRAFVLRYFGERKATPWCGACDNCVPA